MGFGSKLACVIIGCTGYGFLRLRIRSSVGLCLNSNRASCSAKCGNFVDRLEYKCFSIFGYFLSE
jgi:hypothetical protein